MWSGFYLDEEVRVVVFFVSRVSRRIFFLMVGMMVLKLIVFFVVVMYGGLVVGVV